MALILTLGLLAIVTLAVVAFVVTMRIEHLAAGNTLNRTMARQYIDIGLSEAMGAVDGNLLLTQSTYPVQGWSGTNASECLYAPATNNDGIYLCRGSATNLLPSALTQQASQDCCAWNITITETNATTGNSGVQVGRVSYLIINISGMMDVHALNADRRQALGEPTTSAYNLINTSAYQRVFLTQPDLTAANQGQPGSNLVTLSYDPNPDVFFTNALAFGTRAFTNNLPPRFNLNSATNFNFQPNYTATATCAVWLATVSNLLGSAGVPYSDQVAWNILNYLDTNPQHTPLVDPAGPPAYRTGYGVKDVPLINKVLLEKMEADYSISVELWYPFVPRASPNNTMLWVGIYTNAKPDVNAATPTLGDFGFSTNVCTMNYGGATEFLVARMPDNPSFTNVDSTHPVWIWPRVLVGGTCVDEAMVTGTTVTNWISAGCWQFVDPRANNSLSNANWYSVATPGLGTTNANCNVRSLPMTIAGAPMRSVGELRYIYAPGMSANVLDLGDTRGAACRDRFTVSTTTNPVHGLVQANTPYTNIWYALVSDIMIGWTNGIHTDTQQKLEADNTAQTQLAGVVARAAWAGIPNANGIGGWNRYEEMLPMIATNIDLNLGSAATTNAEGFAEREDILAGIADRVSFRQNTFLVIVCGQRLSPLGRVLADQRAAITVVRDAFTGRWVVDHAVWLTE